MSEFDTDRLRSAMLRFLQRAVPILDSLPSDVPLSSAAAWEDAQKLDEYRELTASLEADDDVRRDSTGFAAFAMSASGTTAASIARYLLSSVEARRRFGEGSCDLSNLVTDVVTYFRRPNMEVVAVSPAYGLQLSEELVPLNKELTFARIPPEVLQHMPIIEGPLGLEGSVTRVALVTKVTIAKASLYDETRRSTIHERFRTHMFGARRLATYLSYLCWEDGLCCWWTAMMAYPANPRGFSTIQIDTVPDAAVLMRPHLLTSDEVAGLDRLWKLLHRLKPVEGRRVSSALEWAYRGFVMNDQFLATVHLYTALEALFMKDDERQELAERLALRVAVFVGKDQAERLELYRTIKRGYELRSLAVHRGRWDQNKKYKKGFPMGMAREINRLTKAALLRYLEADEKERFMLQDDYWERALLGGIAVGSS